MDEIALWVKGAVPLIAVYLDKLLENGRVASNTLDCKAGGIVPMAKDGAVVLIVRVLGAKEGGTDGACKVLDVVLFVWKKSARAMGKRGTDRRR